MLSSPTGAIAAAQAQPSPAARLARGARRSGPAAEAPRVVEHRRRRQPRLALRQPGSLSMAPPWGSTRRAARRPDASQAVVFLFLAAAAA